MFYVKYYTDTISQLTCAQNTMHYDFCNKIYKITTNNGIRIEGPNYHHTNSYKNLI